MSIQERSTRLMAPIILLQASSYIANCSSALNFDGGVRLPDGSELSPTTSGAGFAGCDDGGGGSGGSFCFRSFCLYSSASRSHSGVELLLLSILGHSRV